MVFSIMRYEKYEIIMLFKDSACIKKLLQSWQKLAKLHKWGYIGTVV